MSIATAIQNAQQKIADAYTAISNKGGTLPATQNLSNMPTAIDSISSGGGDHGGAYLIQVVDEYGNVLKQDHLNEGATFEMPTPPTRTGLTFEKWIGGAPIVNGNVTMPDYDVYFMPIYCTTSGAYELKFRVITAPATITFQNVYDPYTCDWGDGSTPDTLNNTSSHTYTNAGVYTVSVTTNDNCWSDFYSYLEYPGEQVEIIEINNSNVQNANGYKLFGASMSPSGSMYNPDYLMRPSSVSTIAHLSSAYPSAIPSNNMSMEVNDYYKMVIPDYTLNSSSGSGGATNYTQSYMNTSATNIQEIKGIYYILGGYTAQTTIVSLASTINSISYSLGEQYGNTYYLKNLTNTPRLSVSGSAPYFSNLSDKIIVPFNMWATLIRDSNWARIKPVLTSKTPATINPTIGTGATLTVFGDSITGQFLSYGSEFDFIYNDGTNTYTGTYTGLQPNSVNNIDFGVLPYKVITINCGVSGLTITSDAQFVDNSDGTYSAYIYTSSTSLNYSIDGGTSYMDASGTIDLTQQSPITETVTLVPATITTWTQPTLTSNGTIGGNKFAVSSLFVQSNYVWRAFDSSDSTTWGQSSTNILRYNEPVLMVYNPEGLNISQIVFHTNYTSARYPITTSSSQTYGRKFQASKDGVNWVTLDASSAVGAEVQTDRIVTINNNTEFYKYYRYAYTSSSDGSTWQQMFDLNKRIDITATYKVPAIT